MTRKQKHLLTRILVAAVLFLAGSLLHLPEYVEMGVFLVCYLIVFLAQCFPALRVFPYPGFKGFPHHFLFLLGQHGFFRVEDTLFRAVCIVDGVIHPAVPQI